MENRTDTTAPKTPDENNLGDDKSFFKTIFVTNGEKFSLEWEKIWEENGFWPFSKKIIHKKWHPITKENPDNPFSEQYYHDTGTKIIICNSTRLLFDSKEEANQWIENYNKKWEEQHKKETWVPV